MKYLTRLFLADIDLILLSRHTVGRAAFCSAFFNAEPAFNIMEYSSLIFKVLVIMSVMFWKLLQWKLVFW